MTVPNFRWSLYDPQLDTTIRWPQNPLSGALPQREKNLTIDASTGGGAVVWEGASKPITMPFRGTITERDHYLFFDAWYRKPHKVKITDDLGNEAWAYLTKFTPDRQLSTSHPWKAEYDCSMLVLSFTIGGG